MSDRGSCKVFSPNVFNPTKCQNCFKPKEGHPSGPVTQPGGKMQRGISLANTREKVRIIMKFFVALLSFIFLLFSEFLTLTPNLGIMAVATCTVLLRTQNR